MLAAVIGVCAALFLTAQAVVMHVYYPGQPDVDYPPPTSTEMAREQDLDYFRHYLDLDRSYTPASRATAEQILAALEPRLDSITDGQFELEIARAVAAADNGHSNIWMGSFSRRHGRIPIRTYWFSDGLYVVSAQEPYQHLLGAKITGIGDADFETASKRLRQFVGGTWEAFRAYRGPALFELPIAHHAAGLTESESITSMHFMLPGEKDEISEQIPVQPIAEGEPLHWPRTYLFKLAPGDESDTSWARLSQQIDSTPVYLEQSEQQFRMAELPEAGLYVQFRANYGDGIEAFQQRVRARLKERPVSWLVVDQRFNGGGDYTLTEKLMLALPELAPSAELYMITGPGTFSAGINSVAFARSAAGSELVLVGERIGDRERIYGETNDFILPNSGLGMTFNTGLHDVENGCPPWPQCYYRNYLSDIAVGKLDPDVLVETRMADYLEGRDPVLAYIEAAHLKQQ